VLEIHLGVGLGHTVSLPALALAGLVVGYIAGMFGVGGGFLLVPTLIYLFGVPIDYAVGSAICQQCGTSISSFLKFRTLHRGEPRIDLIMAGGSLVGVDAGARLMTYLDSLGTWRIGAGAPAPAARIVVDLCFIVLLTFTACFTFSDAWQARKRIVPRGDLTIPGPLITRVRIPPFVDLPNVQLKQVSVPMIAYLGFILGVASGLLGVGGGVLLMPILLYGFGMSLRNAAGTGVLLLFLTVLVGTVEYTLRDRVSLRLAMAVLIGSSIGAQLGALTTHYLANRKLRLIFAGLVACTVVVIVVDLGRAIGI
jgi:uncharacterized membrane protein YfcA